MTPESPIDPRQALEASLTALLLGELPPDQAAFLRHVMAGDPELAKMHQRLKQTIELVRETETAPASEPAPEVAALKLSDERRTALQQHFKTIAPREFKPPRERRVSWLVPLAVAAMLMVLLSSLMLPALSRAKYKSQALSNRAAARFALTESLAERESAAIHSANVSEERARALLAEQAAKKIDTVSSGVAETPVVVAADPASVAFSVPASKEIVLPATVEPAKQISVAAVAPIPSLATPPPTLDDGKQAFGGYALSDLKADAEKQPMLGTEVDNVAGFDWRTIGQASNPRGGGGVLGGGNVSSPAPAATTTGADQSFTFSLGKPEQALPRQDLIASAGNYGGGGMGGGSLGIGMRGGSGGGGGVALPLSAPPALTFVRPPAANTAGRALSEPGAAPSAEALARRYGVRPATPGGVATVDPATGLPVATVQAIDASTGLPNPLITPVDGAHAMSDETLRRQLVNGGESNPAGNAAEAHNILFPQDVKNGGTLLADNFQSIDPKTGLPIVIVERPLRPQIQNEVALTPPSNVDNLNLAFYRATNLGVAANLRGFYDDEEQKEKDANEVARKERSKIVLPEGGAEKRQTDVTYGFSTIAPAQQVAANDGVRRSVKQEVTHEKSAAIEAKKSELQQLVEAQRSLEAGLLTERADLMLPKSSMTETVDKATPPPPPSPGLLAGLGRAFRGEPEARARVRIDRDQSDASGLLPGRQTAGAYDPYFVQNEFEVIQSEAVLGQVIKDLNLNKAWAKNTRASGELKTEETLQLLKKKLEVSSVGNTSQLEIGVKDSKPEEAANIANAIAEAYRRLRTEQRMQLAANKIQVTEQERAKQEQKIREVRQELSRLEASQQTDSAPAKPAAPIPVPQPEVQTRDNAYSTFSLNVSDVSFKLAAASLEKGALPDPASIRSEEFINAFDYRDPEAQAGAPVAFAWERSRYPFAQNRDLLRFSLKTAAQGRQAGRPLNLVLLLDNSGSMERADRVSIIREALRVLATQLQAQDTLSVITFARTARLWVDGVPGSQAGQVANEVGKLTPQGGTNLGDAMDLAYQTALRHYLANGINRVVLLTDGAANLGDVEPSSLKAKVEANRKQGIALDCFGIGWEGYNDDLLEVLTRNGDGRYGFINTPEEAATEFAGQLAGALRVAASDVKVQVEFNPGRVTAYRQIGYAKHQLTKEQFRDNTVNAAQIGAAESGNALYVIETNPAGEGPLGTVRVRYRVPGTTDYQEREWSVPYTGNALALEQSSPAMRLAASAGAFSEWLATSPYAAEVTPDAVLGCLRGVPAIYGADIRPGKLEWMVRQAKSIGGTK